jgi:hypothetical protein
VNDKKVPLYLLLAFALLASFAHLMAPSWYDENYTLAYFVWRGPLVIFTDYHVPNNHILYSFALWLWEQAVGVHLFGSRIFSLLLTSLAIPGLYLAGRALGRREIGLFAAIIFASSHIVGDFSAQLRGYSLSMGLIGLTLGFAAMWWKQDYAARRYALGYVICSTLAIGVIPTNIIFVGAVAGWLLFAGAMWRRPDRWRVTSVLASPLFGLAIYLPVWRQMAASAASMNPTTYGNFLQETAGALFVYDMPWSLPLVAGGLWLLRGRESFFPFLWLAAIIMATFAAPLLFPAPFSRNYVPVIPLVALLGGWSLATLVNARAPFNWLHGTRLAMVVLAVVALVAAREATLGHFESQRWAQAKGKPQNLLDHYHQHDRYNPAEVLAYLAQTPPGSLIVAADDVAMDTLLSRDESLKKHVTTCVILHGREGCILLSGGRAASYVTMLVVDRDETQARSALASIGASGQSYRLESVFDSGNYFKIWQVRF